jgi:hypothetical protein
MVTVLVAMEGKYQVINDNPQIDYQLFNEIITK